LASPPLPIAAGLLVGPFPVCGPALIRRRWLQCGLAALLAAAADRSGLSGDDGDGDGDAADPRDTPIDQLWEPWRRLLSPPTPAQARLIELGQVRFRSDPAALQAADRIALTRFDLQAHVSFRFQHQLVPDPSAGGLSSVLRLTPTPSALDLRHSVTLPERHSMSDRSAQRLLAHEFDHIAISADPRPLRILRELLSQPQRLQQPVEAPQPPTPTDIEQRVQAWRDGVLKQVTGLIQSQYDRLDEESRSGQLPIADREQFFHRLYPLEQLASLGVPIPASLRRWLLRQPDQDTQRHYALLVHR
jgi:hypothetical protein